jgi:hypothetical protein
MKPIPVETESEDTKLVTAYVSKDGKLWLEKSERDACNRALCVVELTKHVGSYLIKNDEDEYGGAIATDRDVADYIAKYFGTIQEIVNRVK